MKVSQIELFGVVAIVLYIAFFSHSPPQVIGSALGNVYVSIALLVGLTYVTLYHNRTIGVLLIVALLLTMTQGIEHLSEKSKVKHHSAAPSSPLVNGGCPNPGTAIGITGKFCRGPCPTGTTLSGNDCVTVSLPANPTAPKTPEHKAAEGEYLHKLATVHKSKHKNNLPKTTKPPVVIMPHPTSAGGVTNIPVPLTPPQSSTAPALTNVVSKVTSDPTAASHLAAAVNADPVTFAPIIANLSKDDTSKTSTSLSALPNPTGPVDKPLSTDVPTPAQSCNVETFAPF